MAVELRFEQGVFGLLGADGVEERRPAQPGDIDVFRDWAQRYDKAVSRDDDAALISIGREINAWLDTRGLEKLRSEERDIRFATALQPDAQQRAFLDVPWELLADRDGYWAQDAIVAYRPARLLGRAAAPAAPAHADLFMLFMAAAPLGETELDFEAEEAGILAATKTLPVQVVVEESGALQPLSDKLALGAPFESLHLSCHGGVTKAGPALALENAFGDKDEVSAARLVEGLGDVQPLLVFLSACRTAEHSAGSMPLVLDLVRGRVPNVIGWDGSVFDRDAIEFAKNFYGELAKRRTVPSAAASARRHLLSLKAQDAGGHHWHLARVYVGPSGCGALSHAAKSARPKAIAGGYQAFLDKKGKVNVASANVFVGRRRETQTVLREFGPDPRHAGIVIHGMGRLGKSSLAARVSNRLAQHQTAVVFGEQPGQYDAASIFSEVVDALPPAQREGLRQTWGAAIRSDARRLQEALQAVLTGPAAVHDPTLGKTPILLVIDDLERILETPVAGQQRTQVHGALRDALRATIRAFDSVRGRTQSRLLLTSRYMFSLPDDNGADLADRLFELQLPPMNERQRQKLLDAEARLARASSNALTEEQAGQVEALLNRACVASGGNPGLLALLSRSAREPSTRAEAEAAIAAVERYRAERQRPTEGDLGQFFVQLALDTYRSALTADEAAQMRAALVFDRFPVPWEVMETAGHAAGVGDPARAIERLLWLGCMDAFHLPGEAACDAKPELAANALARPLYDALTDDERRHLAHAVMEPLYSAWADATGRISADEGALLLFSLALAAKARSQIVNESGKAASFYYWRVRDEAAVALEIVEGALRLLDDQKAAPNLHLIRYGVECADRLGEVERVEALLQRGLASPGGDERAFAMLRGALADRLQRRGQLDEALRIRREEELPVYERLGDVHGRAVTIGQIADILYARGEFDEALRIRREEELPVYERLGAVRERAVAMGQIADILYARGELDEALRIRREEELPVYERLCAVRERAVTLGKIGDVLLARGKLDEALHTLRDEVAPAFEKLGAVREHTVTMGKIADVLFARRDFDEALRIRRKEELPVYERLGDVAARAATMGKIADVLFARGDVGEALRTLREEVTPAFERLGMIRERAVAMGKIADVLFARGDLDEALRIHLDERLVVAQRLRDLDSIAHIRYSCALIRLRKGVEDTRTLETILDELREAYAISRTSGKADAIAAIGQPLGSLLMKVGQAASAIEVLEESARAARTLGRENQVKELEAMMAQARGDGE